MRSNAYDTEDMSNQTEESNVGGAYYKECLQEKLRSSVKSISLSQFFDILNEHASPRLKKSLLRLTYGLSSLDAPVESHVTYNDVAMSGKVELTFQESQGFDFALRAFDALHLSGSEVRVSKSVSFEVHLSEDNLILREIEGLSVVVHALKGRYGCPIMHICLEGDAVSSGNLQVLATNPLTSGNDIPTSLIMMRGRVDQDEPNVSSEERNQLREERKVEARKLRSTYSDIQAMPTVPQPLENALMKNSLVREWTMKMKIVGNKLKEGLNK